MLIRQSRVHILCLNRCFDKKGQPFSSLFHIPTGFAHNSGHAGGLRGFSSFSTDRETVYQNCLPLCMMGRKTWRHGDPHAQNYDICGDNLAGIIWFTISMPRVKWSTVRLTKWPSTIGICFVTTCMLHSLPMGQGAHITTVSNWVDFVLSWGVSDMRSQS